MITFCRLCGWLVALMVLTSWPVLGAESASAVTSTNPMAKWDKELAAFDLQDQKTAPPKHANLFVGSSSFRLWKDTGSYFPGKKVINRGFGGSQMEDLLKLTDRLVLRYDPAVVLVYEGDNDLASGKKPEKVVEQFISFCSKVRASLPKTRIVFVSIKPSPKRWEIVEKARETNKLIADYIRAQSDMVYVDVFGPMLGPDGKPKPEIFVQDNLHLNESGYKIWAPLIAPYLQ